jgi:transcriptional regulator with XRE-family HTH domain
MGRRARSREEREADARLGERLRAIRKQRGVTQVDLAQAIGTTQNIVSDYERGKLRPNTTILTKLAAVLQVSSDEILGIALPSAGAPLSRRFLRRLRAVESLPRRDQEALLRTIDAFLSARKAS